VFDYIDGMIKKGKQPANQSTDFGLDTFELGNMPFTFIEGGGCGDGISRNSQYEWLGGPQNIHDTQTADHDEKSDPAMEALLERRRSEVPQPIQRI
tara:strand:+ start:434 stop:721 length:288 start_codon:yes stop_codon:yes gene_type:complete